MTILEIAETVQEMTGGCEIVHTPPRPGDFPGKEISSERAREELGWTADTTLPRGCSALRRLGARLTQAPAAPTRCPATASVNGDRAPTALLAGSEKAEEEPTRVLVLTADIGEGHDLPARIIAAEVEQEIPGSRGRDRQWPGGDGADLSHAVICGGSKVTFRWMPWLFDIQYWLIARFAPTRWLATDSTTGWGPAGCCG